MIWDPRAGLHNMRDPGILDPRHFFFARYFDPEISKLPLSEQSTRLRMSSFAQSSKKTIFGFDYLISKRPLYVNSSSTLSHNYSTLLRQPTILK